MSNKINKKPFDKELFKAFDEAGKTTVRKYFENEGFLVAYNPNDYEADLILLEKQTDGSYLKIALVEIGVRDSWKSHQWPAKWDLRIEARKAKYLNQDLPVWFCILNAEHTAMVGIDTPLTDFPIQKISNRLIQDEENYVIPATELNYVEIIKTEEKELF